MVKTLTRLVIALALVLCYQNCAPMKTAPEAAIGDDVVKASTSMVERVTYDPMLESKASGSELLVIDRMTAEMTLTVIGGTPRSCPLDPVRRSSFESVLEGGRVCNPGPLPPDTVSCMAIGLADIRLENSDGDVVELRPVICNHGTFLCDGRDETFRALLADLAQNPPAGCR